MMIYYEIIAGSRCYGLNIESSDIDLCRVSNSWNTTGHENNYHVIQVPRKEFVDRAMLLRETPLYIQWLFPYEVVTPGMVWDFILDRRDELVFSVRRRVWDLHFCAADGLSLYPEHYYPRFPKRLAYSTLFYDTLARYASGVPFAQAIRPEESMRKMLLEMRRQRLQLSDAIAINEEAKKRATAAYDFYDTNVDFVYLEQTKNELSSILFKDGR